MKESEGIGVRYPHFKLKLVIFRNVNLIIYSNPISQLAFCHVNILESHSQMEVFMKHKKC